MAVCKIEIARVWSALLKPVQPVHPVSDFKNYIAYQQQQLKQRPPVTDFKVIFAKEMAK